MALLSKVGPYRVLGHLGTGGMGVVYAGVDATGRRAAVKVLHAGSTNSDHLRKRLQREARSLAAVSSPHVARVLAADVDGDTPYIAFEYIDGPTLAQHVERDGPLDQADAARAGHALTEAVNAMHLAGVIHRDIKPANVMLSARGPVLIDFGIAHLADGTALTSGTTTFGSAGWLAPEMLTGDGSATTACDVFGLGATLAYAASGRPPFGTGRLERVFYRTLNEDPDLSHVPPVLRAVLGPSLDRAPDRRPGMAALQASLRQVAAGADPQQPYQPGSRPASTWPTTGTAPALVGRANTPQAYSEDHGSEAEASRTPAAAPGDRSTSATSALTSLLHEQHAPSEAGSGVASEAARAVRGSRLRRRVALPAVLMLVVTAAAVGAVAAGPNRAETIGGLRDRERAQAPAHLDAQEAASGVDGSADEPADAGGERSVSTEAPAPPTPAPTSRNPRASLLAATEELDLPGCASPCSILHTLERNWTGEAGAEQLLAFAGNEEQGVSAYLIAGVSDPSVVATVNDLGVMIRFAGTGHWIRYDSTGNAFVNVAGASVTALYALNFSTPDTMRVVGPYGTDGAFVNGQVEDVAPDGSFTLLADDNDCVPSCAEGTTYTSAFVWDGQAYAPTDI